MNIILDIDGTLWNTTEIVANAWNDAIEDVGLIESLGRFITAPMLQKEFGKPMDTIIDDLFPGQNSDIKEQILITVKKHESSAIRTCTDALAFPNVSSSIHALREMGHNLYIVSNCQEGYIELVMEILDIEKDISDYESFGVTGLSKADNIRLIVNRNNLLLSDTYYVGDTLGDYDSSTQAGVKFIFASYGFGEMAPDYKGLSIESFSELTSFFTL